MWEWGRRWTGRGKIWISTRERFIVLKSRIEAEVEGRWTRTMEPSTTAIPKDCRSNWKSSSTTKTISGGELPSARMRRKERRGLQGHNLHGRGRRVLCIPCWRRDFARDPARGIIRRPMSFPRKCTDRTIIKNRVRARRMEGSILSRGC